jgi:hypothetical protein
MLIRSKPDPEVAALFYNSKVYAVVLFGEMCSGKVVSENYLACKPTHCSKYFTFLTTPKSFLALIEESVLSGVGELGHAHAWSRERMALRKTRQFTWQHQRRNS